MFVIRQAKLDDAASLLKLAKMVHFINLPADPAIIAHKVQRSRTSFAGRMEDERERQFTFILEDVDTGNVIGTSSVMSCISWPGRPHTYFQVRRREMYSHDLQTGQVHVTLQFGTDETGPSEIGGLILSPSYRRHRERLGSFLSLVRFHFMGRQRAWFADRMIAEMMGALTPTSSNLLWEYLGRRFINLGYSEADMFCQHSKEFIISLMPREEIYISLLPAEARKLIGAVGPETEPARAMLEKLGFEYKGQIDPFDGGPYLEATVDEISLVKATRAVTFNGAGGTYANLGIVSHFSPERGFRAVRTRYSAPKDGGTITLPRKSAGLIDAEKGDELWVTPLQPERTSGRSAGKTTANGRKASSSERTGRSKKSSSGRRSSKKASSTQKTKTKKKRKKSTS